MSRIIDQELSENHHSARVISEEHFQVREFNSPQMAFFRLCFVAYLVLIFTTVGSVVLFLLFGDEKHFLCMLGLVAGAVLLRKIGFGKFHFEECEKSLDEGFKFEQNTAFEHWLGEIEKLRLDKGENVWERHQRRQNLIREYREHPPYLEKMLERGIVPPDWLA